MLEPRSTFESSNSVTARQSGFPRQAPLKSEPDGGFAGEEAEEDSPFGPEKRSLIARSVEREAQKAAEARQRLRKQIDPLPRVGALLTLDVKSNDLRAGVAYLAQVLKRNRTLRVLNLSDNKIDVGGLVAVAEALVRAIQSLSRVGADGVGGAALQHDA